MATDTWGRVAQDIRECLQHGWFHTGIPRVCDNKQVRQEGKPCPHHTLPSDASLSRLRPAPAYSLQGLQPPPSLYSSPDSHLLPHIPVTQTLPEMPCVTLGPVCNQGPQTDADKANKTQGQHGAQGREDPATWQRAGRPREHQRGSSIQRMGTQ